MSPICASRSRAAVQAGSAKCLKLAVMAPCCVLHRVRHGRHPGCKWMRCHGQRLHSSLSSEVTADSVPYAAGWRVDLPNQAVPSRISSKAVQRMHWKVRSSCNSMFGHGTVRPDPRHNVAIRRRNAHTLADCKLKVTMQGLQQMCCFGASDMSGSQHDPWRGVSNCTQMQFAYRSEQVVRSSRWRSAALHELSLIGACLPLLTAACQQLRKLSD